MPVFIAHIVPPNHEKKKNLLSCWSSNEREEGCPAPGQNTIDRLWAVGGLLFHVPMHRMRSVFVVYLMHSAIKSQQNAPFHLMLDCTF